jgi:antitoxin CptB
MASAEASRRLERLQFRASHRGTKEMDWLLGRFAAARLAQMSPDEVDCFEALVALPDPDVQDWILASGAVIDPDFASLVAELRRFHGLPQDP